MKTNSQISPAARLLSGLLRLPPLMSGCGKIASLSLLKSLTQTSGPVWVKTRDGSKLLCYVDDYVGRALFYFGDLDPKLSWVLKKVLKPGDRFIDVGANIGIMTILGSKLVGETGGVLAFEPQPKVLRCLNEGISKNEAKNVQVQTYGLGAAPGKLTLHIPAGNLGGASFRNIPQEEVEALEVEVKTLAEAVEDTPFAEAKLVKLDVEGVEGEVIEGAESIWREQPPEVVIFEFREDGQVGDTDAGSRLRSLGYDFYRLPRNWFFPRLVPEKSVDAKTPVSHDVVAVHRSAPYDPLEYFNSK